MVKCEIIELEPQLTAALGEEVRLSKLPIFFGCAYPKVMAAIEEAGAQIIGPPFGFYPKMPTDSVLVEAGFATSTPVASGDVHSLMLPGGPAVSAVHVGPYETMEKTYTEMQKWVTSQGLEVGEAVVEYYLSDPESHPDPKTWETRIVWTLQAKDE